jgi:polysaccharide pyruvyl transferase WcaK-like protein
MTPSRQSQSPRRILLSGMFDMRNFGDLLFPLVARERLSGFEPGFEILPVSPTGAATGFTDALPSVALTEMMTGEREAHGILVGGGYMIHGHKMHFLEEYAAERDYAGPGLWLGATLAAAACDIPIAWNAPGVPHPFARSQRPLVDAALRATDYVSLRDTGSLELLEPPADVAVDVVPDPIASLASLWPKPMLTAPFKALLERKGARREARHLALHFRNRSLARFGVEAAAKAVDAFAQTQGLTPILVAVGQTHDDDTLARDIAGRLTGPHILLDDPSTLIEIASVFGESALYIGASLHGYIAAAAYGVPAVLVAQPSYRKFQGFLDHTGRSEDLARDWPGAFTIASHRADKSVPMSTRVLDALDAHWRRIAEALSDPARRRAERHAFLRDWLRAGAQAGGAAWPHLPYARRGAE